MPGPGRNQPCPCDSGRKTNHCCGQRRGPSDAQLARAHVALLARQATPDLAGLSDRALDHLWEGLMDLPGLDISLLVTLPTLISPDLQRLREAIEHDDPDWGWDALTAVRLLVCDWWRSMRKAASASMPCCSIKIPLACSIVARRLNAPSRTWYSAKRRSATSIEL